MEEREAGKAEAEELDDEDNPNRGESSEVSCLDSDSEETSQYSSMRDNFSESGVRKERVQMCIRDRERTVVLSRSYLGQLLNWIRFMYGVIVLVFECKSVFCLKHLFL